MKWVVLATLIAASVVRLPAPVVRTTSGLVRGRLAESGRVRRYLGIPYGTVNESNRFKAPLPPPTWEGIYDAVDENTWCPQRFLSSALRLGQPDCLKLNVYTPAAAPAPAPARLLPVMVFVHGGCFFEGTGSPFLYGGDYFTDYGVVIVGINYRLSVEGFLCLGIEEAPGNAGLKDQIAALKWVKENIQAFGGDPDNVTLFGESAGAVSISFLILSPAARGLFHKVILQSGSSLAPWGIQHDPIETARTLVKELGYDTKDPYETHKILSSKSPDELIKAIKYARNKNWITADNLFVPCVENEIAGVEPIITEFPLDIIRSGNYTKVPMVIGFNDKEGIFFVAKDFDKDVREVDTADLLKRDLIFPSEGSRNATVEMLGKHYFAGKDQLIMDVVDFYSDLHFKFPSVVESEMYLRTTEQPIYFYLFQYSGLLNVPKAVSWFLEQDGASHADELFYMFKPRLLPTPQRWMETLLMQRMLTLWTNFAKYNDPTPTTSRLLPIKWRPSSEWGRRALVIDTRLSTARVWDNPAIRMWNNTYNLYRRNNYGFKRNNYGFKRNHHTKWRRPRTRLNDTRDVCLKSSTC